MGVVSAPANLSIRMVDPILIVAERGPIVVVNVVWAISNTLPIICGPVAVYLRAFV